MDIHPTAVIHHDAELEDNVSVGPYSIIGPNVYIGKDTHVTSHVVIDRNTTIGTQCRISHGAIIGTPPQDVKYKNEETKVVIGNRNIIREYVTINRATGEGCATRIGDDNFLMAYVHIAHNCDIGNHVIMANAATLAGHVVIEDYAVIGGLTPIHQFVRIGCYAMVGGASRVAKDVVPYVKAAGSPLRISGLNTIGLNKYGFSAHTKQLIKSAYNLLFRSGLNVTQAIERIKSELSLTDEINHLIYFIESSKRGISK